MKYLIAQQVLVPLILLLCGLVLPSPHIATGPDLVFNAYPAVLGVFVALLVRGSDEGVLRSGRWIWVVPTLALIYEATSGEATMEYLFSASGPTEGLPLMLVTIPAFGSAAYALTITAIGRGRQAVG